MKLSLIICGFIAFVAGMALVAMASEPPYAKVMVIDGKQYPTTQAVPKVRSLVMSQTLADQLNGLDIMRQEPRVFLSDKELIKRIIGLYQNNYKTPNRTDDDLAMRSLMMLDRMNEADVLPVMRVAAASPNLVDQVIASGFLLGAYGANKEDIGKSIDLLAKLVAEDKHLPSDGEGRASLAEGCSWDLEDFFKDRAIKDYPRMKFASGMTREQIKNNWAEYGQALQKWCAVHRNELIVAVKPPPPVKELPKEVRVYESDGKVFADRLVFSEAISEDLNLDSAVIPGTHVRAIIDYPQHDAVGHFVIDLSNLPPLDELRGKNLVITQTVNRNGGIHGGVQEEFSIPIKIVPAP